MARKVGTEPFYGLSMNPFHLLIVVGITIGSYYLANTHWSFGKVELPLKHYYPVGLDKYGRDTIYEHMPPFSLMTQKGDTFSVAHKNKFPFMLVLTAYSPSNDSLERQKALGLQKVQEVISGQDDIGMSSLIVDSIAYPLDELQAIAQKLNASPETWSILSGNWDDVDLLLNNGMHLGVDKETLALRHPDRVVLIDKQGYTRGRYEGGSPTFAEELIEDIEKLRKEYSSDVED